MLSSLRRQISLSCFLFITLLLLSHDLLTDSTRISSAAAAASFVVVDKNSQRSSQRRRRIAAASYSHLPLFVVNGVDDDAQRFPHAYIAEQARKDFEILMKRTIGGGSSNNNKEDDEAPPLVYLDSAATSQKPQPVLDKLNHYYHNTHSNVHRGAHTLSREATTEYEAARDKVVDFIHANSRNEIIFTSGATEAMNLVVQSYGRTFLQQGDEIVLTVSEHHSNLVPWQMLAKEKGLKLKFVPLKDDGLLDWEQLPSLLTDKTKFVAFQHVSNVLGCINPVQDIVQTIHKHAHPDCKILLDACQSVPHMPVNVQELGVDFMAASGHKLCGPTGIGFLWGREDLLNAMPPWKGGGEMIDQVTLTESTWQPAPARFEAGTPAIAQAIGLGAAIDYLENIGMENIAQYEHELAEYLYERLSNVPGVTILGPPAGQTRAALCAFSVDTVHPSDLSTFLDMEGVAIRAGHHCCQPLHTELGISHSARASLYFYNTKEDIDEFIRHLEGTIKFFTKLESGGATSSEDEEEFVPFI